jgi:hypothetical protein
VDEEVLYPLTGLDLSAHILAPQRDGQPPPIYDLYAVSVRSNRYSRESA